MFGGVPQNIMLFLGQMILVVLNVIDLINVDSPEEKKLGIFQSCMQWFSGTIGQLTEQKPLQPVNLSETPGGAFIPG